MPLTSKSTIRILDLLCEGPIEGFANGINPASGNSSIFLNDNPISIKGNESFNEADVGVFINKGGKNFELKKKSGKKVIDHTTDFQKAKKTEIININEEIGSNYSETLKTDNTVQKRNYGGGQILKQITETDADNLTLIFTVPALYSQAIEGIASGQLFSARINVEISIKSVGSGTGFKKIAKENTVVDGVITSNFQFDVTIKNLKTFIGDPPYIVKIKKVVKEEKDYDITIDDFENTPKKTPLQNKRANQLILTSFLLKTNSGIDLTKMACVGLEFSSEVFPQLPTRSYLIKGKKVKTFSNSTVEDDGRLTFTDEFDGNFKLDDDGTFTKEYTTCPVCCFIDMLTDSTYGAGDFVNTNNLSLVDLYPIARYCNELVETPDGEEPRFAINTVIASQTSAYKLLQNMASVFRGMTFWASNTVNVGADHGNLDGSDIDPVHLYSNSSVIDGTFSYAGTSVKTRSNKIIVNYNDPDNNYKIDQIVVQDDSLITKFGLQEKEIVAFGCTSKYQAQRMGQYMLKSEELDAEVVTFSTGLDGLFVLPSQVFAIADVMRAGTRLSGRVGSGSTNTHIVVDINYSASLLDIDSSTDFISLTLADGTVEKIKINSITSDGRISILSAPSSLPLQNSVYVIERSTVQTQKFRCINIQDDGNGTYTITGVQHNDSIYKAADNTDSVENLIVDDKLLTTFDDKPSIPTDLVVSFTKVKTNNNTVNRALFEWSRGINGQAIKYDIKLFNGGKNVVDIENYGTTSFEIDNLETVGFTFKVKAVGFTGLKSDFTEISGTVPNVTSNTSTGSVTIESDVTIDLE